MKMKTVLSFIFLTIISFNPLKAQWVPIDSTLNQRWTSVFFTNESTGYVAGYLSAPQYYAKIEKTTNGGISWYPLTIPPPITADGYLLVNIFFIDANTGFVPGGRVGYYVYGMILKTTNGGNNWDTLSLPPNNEYTSVYFVNSSTGYATGYAIIVKTTNGGTSWTTQNPNNFGNYMTKVVFTDASTGYAAGLSGTILKTTDGGNNWLAENSGTSVDFNGLDFADANTGVAVGGFSDNSANVIVRTTNAGNNWVTIDYSTSTCMLWRVRFMSPTVGYIAGYCGQIIKTTDGGASWCVQSSPVNNNFTECFFTSNSTGYIAGRAPIPGMQGFILKTTNGGGICTPIGITPAGNEIPSQYYLYQNYPNPFNPTTKISYSLPKAGHVKLIVIDVLGRVVTTLVNKELRPGKYETTWNASNYPSGIYFYRFTTGSNTETRKMVLVK
jgi:photosystem II stability/assembly factor-like uncharacterized protein